MKKIILFLIILLSFKSYAQSNADAIIGKWLKIPKNDLIIDVYKVKDEYQGMISWAKDNDKRKPVGFILLDKLRYNPKSKKWENGKVHDPNSGKTYNAIVQLKSDGILDVYAYLGLRIFGTTRNFKRTQ